MKRIITVILVLFFIAAPFTSVQAATFKSYKVIITTSQLNIRSTASTKGKLIGYYYKNNIVNIIGQSGSWLKTSKGYIASSYTKKYTASTNASTANSAAANSAAFKNYKAVITTSMLNIRSTASTRGKLIGHYYMNNIVDITGQSGSWLKTPKGYIASSYTKEYKASTTTANAEAFKNYKVVITTSELNIRSTASTSGKLLGKYYMNNIVDITGLSGSWLKTSKGYIASSYTKEYTATTTTASRGNTEPSTQIIKSLITLNNPEFYNSNKKEIIVFPVTQSISPSTGNSNEELVPDYLIEKAGTSVQITLNNMSAVNEYMNSFDTLKKNLTIKNTADYKVIISAGFAENTDVNIYTVRRKASTVNNIQYLKTYIVLSLSAPNLNQSPDTNSTPRPLVVIDPGHGGTDPGACANGLKEENLNLDIALKLKQNLEQQGYDTYITRSTDIYVDLLDRADAANLFKADLFVSIHNNANDSLSYNGTTVLYNSKAVMPVNSLPQIMQSEIVQALGTNALRLEDRPGLVVLNSTWVPSVLAEVAVITNQNDAAVISQEVNRQAVADAILRAINRYYGF